MEGLGKMLQERMDVVGVQSQENTEKIMDQAKEMVCAPRLVASVREID